MEVPRLTMMRNYSRWIHKSVHIQRFTIFIFMRSRRTSCHWTRREKGRWREECRSFGEGYFIYLDNLCPLFRGIWVREIECKLVIEQRILMQQGRRIVWLVRGSNEKTNDSGSWAPEDELNYEWFIPQDFLVMNGACKYARMHNKTAARRVRCKYDGRVIYFIETFASCNQTARLKRRASSRVEAPSLIMFKLKLK